MSVHSQPALPPAAAPARATGSLGVAATATADGFTVRRHTDLATIAPLWRTLENAGAATAYQRLDWTENLIAHLAAESRATPFFIEVVEAESGRPLMLVPLALVRRRGHAVVTWLDLGVCDYAAPLLAPGTDLTAPRMERVWKAVRSVLPRADLIRISRIPASVQGRPNPFAALAACRRMAMQASGIAIDGDAGTLLDRLCRPSTRKDMAKLRRRLERQGAVAFTQASTAMEVDAIFDALVEQRRSRFAEMGRFDLLSRPDVAAFYRAGAHAGLGTGAARLFGLSVDGHWIAAAYGLVHGGTFHGILLTMEGGPWRNTSPGLHIVADCLSWARADGLTYFDFTVGTMPYKSDFGVQSRPLDEITAVLSPSGFVVTQVLRRSEDAKEWLRAHPDWFARLQKGRRWLRRRFQVS